MLLGLLNQVIKNIIKNIQNVTLVIENYRNFKVPKHACKNEL